MLYLSQWFQNVVAKCSTKVLQKAPTGAFCNTFVLHLAVNCLYISIIYLLYKCQLFCGFYFVTMYVMDKLFLHQDLTIF